MPIKLTDQQFDKLIKHARLPEVQSTIQLMDDENYQYMRNRARVLQAKSRPLSPPQELFQQYPAAEQLAGVFQGMMGELPKGTSINFPAPPPTTQPTQAMAAGRLEQLQQAQRTDTYPTLPSPTPTTPHARAARLIKSELGGQFPLAGGIQGAESELTRPYRPMPLGTNPISEAYLQGVFASPLGSAYRALAAGASKLGLPGAQASLEGAHGLMEQPPTTLPAKLAAQAGGVVTALPAFEVAGGMVGKLAPELNSIVKAAATFGTVGAFGEAMDQAAKGDADLAKLALRTGQEAFIGGALGGAARLTRTAPSVVRVAAETGALTGAGAVAHLQLPTVEDLLGNALLVGAFQGMQRMGDITNQRRAFNYTKEVVMDTYKDKLDDRARNYLSRRMYEAYKDGTLKLEDIPGLVDEAIGNTKIKISTPIEVGVEVPVGDARVPVTEPGKQGQLLPRPAIQSRLQFEQAAPAPDIVQQSLEGLQRPRMERADIDKLNTAHSILSRELATAPEMRVKSQFNIVRSLATKFAPDALPILEAAENKYYQGDHAGATTLNEQAITTIHHAMPLGEWMVQSLNEIVYGGTQQPLFAPDPTQLPLIEAPKVYMPNGQSRTIPLEQLPTAPPPKVPGKVGPKLVPKPVKPVAKPIAKPVAPTPLETAASKARARLKARAKGLTASGGFEPLFGAMFDYAVIGAEKISRGVKNNKLWRKEMLKEGVKEQDLDRIWEASHLEYAKQVATDNGFAVATNLEANGPDTAPLRHLLAARFQASPDSPLVTQVSGRSGQFLRNMSENFLGSSPRLTHLLRQDPAFYNLVERLVSSSHTSRMMTELMHDDVMTLLSGQVNPTNGKFEPGKLDLTNDTVKRREHLFAKFLNSEQAKGIKARNAAEEGKYNDLKRKQSDLINAQSVGAPTTREMQLTADEVQFLKDYQPPKAITIPELSKMEQAAFDADPVMQQTLQWWLNSWQPYIESVAPEAGILTQRITPSGVYSKVKWYPSPDEVSVGTRLHEPPSQGGTGSFVWNYAKTRARAARRATGTAPEGFALSEELKEIMLDTLSDRLTTANKRTLIDGVVSHAAKEGRPGDTVEFGGEKVKLVTHTVDRPLGPAMLRRETYLVPKPIKDSYDYVMSHTREAGVKEWNTWSKYLTASALLVPAEATMHGLGVLASLAQTPGIGQSSKLARGISWVPLVGRMTAAMADIYSLEGDTFRADLITVAPTLRSPTFDRPSLEVKRARQLRTLATSPAEYGKQLKIDVAKEGPISALGERIPFLHGLKDYVFGFPNYEHGFNGLEARVKVAMLRALRHGDPTITDAQARNLINNQLGTYLAKLEPQLVTLAKNVDPFARAGTALTKTGIKSLAGFGPQGFSPELFLSTISTGLALALVVKWSTGRWPFPVHDERGKLDVTKGFHDLPAGNIPIISETGKRYEIPFRITANSTYRGLRAIGLKQATERYMLGETDKQQLGLSVMMGIANFGLGRLGPPFRALFQTMTGRIPYLVGMPSHPELMSAEDPTTVNPLFKRFETFMSTGVPAYGKWGDTYTEHGEAHPDSPIGEHLYFIAKLLGGEPLIRPNNYSLTTQGAISRDRQRRVEDVVWSINRGARNIANQEERSNWVREQLTTRLKPDEIPYAINMLKSTTTSMPGRYARTAALGGAAPIPR